MGTLGTGHAACKLDPCPLHRGQEGRKDVGLLILDVPMSPLPTPIWPSVFLGGLGQGGGVFSP